MRFKETIMPAAETKLARLVLLLVSITAGLQGWSREYTVIRVEKELDMGLGREPAKDFYLNMGAAQGLRVGSYVQILRRTPVIDPFNQNKSNDMMIPIGQLRIIHLERDQAIARLARPLKSRAPAAVQVSTDLGRIPVVAIPKPIVGDVVELIE
jgi:hypothetical protein